MPRRPVLCPKCGRKFAMALHLGRHMSATHGTARTTAPAFQAPAQFNGGAVVSIQSARSELEARRAEVDRQLEALDRAW